jgi:predicted GNAT family acetyltransferase
VANIAAAKRQEKAESMEPAKFRAYHEPALEADEVKHGLILNALARMDATPLKVSCWSLGRPGECAIKMTHHSIVLGMLDENQCRTFAESTVHIDYPGVVGPDLTAKWFTDRAQRLSVQFLEPVPQQIYSISGKPRYPGASGHARGVTSQDATLLADWLTAFYREAVPHDPVPAREELERAAGEGRFLFWICNGEPVSLAGIVRRLKRSAAITGVYTPPQLRGLGFAGSVVSATVERIYADGRKIACLYADLRNPASNRCYFENRICAGLHVPAFPEKWLAAVRRLRSGSSLSRIRCQRLAERRAGPTDIGTGLCIAFEVPAWL